MVPLGRKPFRDVPSFLRKVPFDLIVFHTDLLGLQYPSHSTEQFIEKAEVLRNIPAVKVVLAQDEHFNPNAIAKFINDFGIDHVFSLAPESEWKKIYPTVDLNKVKFYRTLPGYLDEKTLKKISKLQRKIPRKDIDIGYRAYGVRYHLGRHGFLKIKIADVFNQKTVNERLKVDISTRTGDIIYGDKWYEFLLRCKYTIAVEGGATVLDPDGKIMPKSLEFIKTHPGARFEDVENACFPGLDGQIQYMAISPKHLEACATRSCQILIEGEYNGILKPGIHYIELKKDFGNIDDVLDIVRKDELREEIVEKAYREIASTSKYTYNRYVEFILEKCLKKAPDPMTEKKRWPVRLLYLFSLMFEGFTWCKLVLYCLLSRALRSLKTWLNKR